MVYEYDPVTIHNSRRVFGFAVRHDPFDLYEAIGAPRPLRMVDLVVEHTKQGYLHEAVATSHEARAFEIFGHGVRDTQTLIQPFLRAKSAEAGREFIASDEACRWLATLALRADDDDLNGFAAIISETNDHYKYVTDAKHPTDPHPKVLSPNPERGCPFAGHNGAVDIDPLFRKFVTWAGSLALAAVEAHDLRSRNIK